MGASLPYEITLLSNHIIIAEQVLIASLPYEITLLSNLSVLYILHFASFTTIRNYTTLKQDRKLLTTCLCFTTIRNYTTLKLHTAAVLSLCSFTTIRNYTTLKRHCHR